MKNQLDFFFTIVKIQSKTSTEGIKICDHVSDSNTNNIFHQNIILHLSMEGKYTNHSCGLETAKEECTA